MKKSTLGIIFVLIAGTLWGTMGVFVNYFNSIGLGSIETAGVRVAFASILVAIFLLFKNKKLFKIKLRDLWCFFGSGIISLMIFTICYFKTIILASMSVAAVLLYTSPVFVMLFSFFIFKEKITKKKAISCIVCVAGCVAVTGILSGSASVPVTATLLGISSGIAYALYSIFSRFALQKGYPSIVVTFYTFLFATVGMLPIISFENVKGVLSANPSAIFVMALSGLVTAVLPYLFYTMGLEKIESGKAAIIAAIEPVVATIIGSIFFHDNLSILQYLGIGLVLLSIVLQNEKKKSVK